MFFKAVIKYYDTRKEESRENYLILSADSFASASRLIERIYSDVEINAVNFEILSEENLVVFNEDEKEEFNTMADLIGEYCIIL